VEFGDATAGGEVAGGVPPQVVVLVRQLPPRVWLWQQGASGCDQPIVGRRDADGAEFVAVVGADHVVQPDGGQVRPVLLDQRQVGQLFTQPAGTARVQLPQQTQHVERQVGVFGQHPQPQEPLPVRVGQ
jgi:hypothetical protein